MKSTWFLVLVIFYGHWLTAQSCLPEGITLTTQADIDNFPLNYPNCTANIVFDFNPPITTNTVLHRIGQLTVRTDEPQPYAAFWEVSGNPTRDAATFRAKEFIPGEKRFELYDAAGQRVLGVQFPGQTFDFRRQPLPAGLYFFRIGDARGRVFSGKIVVSE